MTDDDDDDVKPAKASTNFRVKEDEEVKSYECHMIEKLDDIRQIMNNYSGLDKDTTVYLIHKDDDLNDLLFQCMENGYSPCISHRLGNVVTLLNLKN